MQSFKIFFSPEWFQSHLNFFWMLKLEFTALKSLWSALPLKHRATGLLVVNDGRTNQLARSKHFCPEAKGKNHYMIVTPQGTPRIIRSQFPYRCLLFVREDWEPVETKWWTNVVEVNDHQLINGGGKLVYSRYTEPYKHLHKTWSKVMAWYLCEDWRIFTVSEIIS